MNNPTTILITAANASDTPQLSLDEEVRDIAEGLKLAKHRDKFVLKQQWATGVRDLRRAVQKHEPKIVHFCGHGAGDKGLAFEDKEGKSQLVSTGALASFFELLADQVECVVLNACSTEVQAEAIAKHISYVVGMSEAIQNKAAIEFAVAFYDSLAAGKSYEEAHKFGCNAIELAGVSGSMVPKLLKKDSRTPAKDIPSGIAVINEKKAVVDDVAPSYNTQAIGPKVFISYSHDSQSHRDFVREIANQLRADGLNCIIDQYVNGFPPEGWQRWMEDQIEAADFVLLVCTETYLKRYRGHEENGGKGVTFEGVVISQSLYDHYYRNSKFVPVIPENGSLDNVPISLKQYSTYTLPKQYDNLYRYLTNQPEHIPPVIGAKRVLSQVQETDSSPAYFNVPIPRNPFFTGRNDILEKLHQTLEFNNEIAIKPSDKATALSGLGGVGKTQTVAEYAHLYKHKYSAVLWVLADSEDSLRSGFAGLASILGFSAEKQDDQILAVQSWLRHNEGWLLIFDNAETLALLNSAQALLPVDAKGHTLFTTRAQATGALASVSVDCFDDEMGSVFLLKRSKWVEIALATPEEVQSHVSATDWKTANELVHELGGLALAIDQAGAYIEQTACGLDGYLSRYRGNAAKMLKLRAGLVPSEEHPEAVYKTFLLAAENAKSRSELAYDILMDSALLHPDGIPEKLYADYDPLELDQALAALKDYSLIERVQDGQKKFFTVHRLIQVVILDVCDG